MEKIHLSCLFFLSFFHQTEIREGWYDDGKRPISIHLFWLAVCVYFVVVFFLLKQHFEWISRLFIFESSDAKECW